jgi:hypothetical protein
MTCEQLRTKHKEVISLFYRGIPPLASLVMPILRHFDECRPCLETLSQKGQEVMSKIDPAMRRRIIARAAVHAALIIAQSREHS